MKQNNRGFSLIETVVAMAILGAFTVAICTCLMLSIRMNEKTSTLMQEQMAVSSAVEELMATGYSVDHKTAVESKYSVSVTSTDHGSYYDVTVAKDNVTVDTQIRKAVG